MNRRDLYTAHAHPCPSQFNGRSQAAAECRASEGHAVVRLSGEFDADSIHVFREVLAATDGTPLVVDLTGITFADSSLLHALIEAHGRIVLTGPLPRQFHRVLDLTGTARQFTIAPDAGAAADVWRR